MCVTLLLFYVCGWVWLITRSHCKPPRAIVKAAPRAYLRMGERTVDTPALHGYDGVCARVVAVAVIDSPCYPPASASHPAAVHHHRFLHLRHRRALVTLADRHPVDRGRAAVAWTAVHRHSTDWHLRRTSLASVISLHVPAARGSCATCSTGWRGAVASPALWSDLVAVVIDPRARGTVVSADASTDCRCTGRAPAYFGTSDDSDRTVVHRSAVIACNSDECTRTVT